MLSKSKFHTVATVSYIIVAVLFMLFLLYMALFVRNDIYKLRDTEPYAVIQNCSVTDITDENAPAGIRKVYSWRLDDPGNEGCSLVFYTVHQYVEVYFDDELMYSLTPDKSNRISIGVSSNWITVPVFQEDIGKEVRVIVTPVYKSVANRNIEFKVGSYSSIYIHQLQSDLPQIILSGLCILLGLIIIMIQIFLIVQKRSDQWNMFYLGNFALMLGLWRITDTRFSPMMFGGNTLVLGYISIGMLFLGIIPLLLFLNGRFAHRNVNSPFLVLAFISSAVAAVVLMCQILGIAEFKQTLIFSHLLIIAIVLLILLTAVQHKRRKTMEHSKSSWIFLLLLSIGALLDIAFFYLNGSSSGIIFTILAFLIYATALFMKNLLNIQREAYNDIQTGLCNKSRWNQLMKSQSQIAGPIGMIMFDLNRLKYTNDTMGHEAGDKLILSFSNILRNSIPHSNMICRWGGDEFTVMVVDADKEKMERYLSVIESAVKKYNESGEKPELSFAAGYALSTEFPGLSQNELFQVADERMYLNKQKWYAETLNTDS